MPATLSDLIRFHLDHDAWATRRVLDACRPLSDADFTRDFGIGPGSLRAALAHILECEFFFADNFAGRPYAERPRWDERTRTVESLTQLHRDAAAELRTALLLASERGQDIPWETSSRGRLSLVAAIAQTFDHATYHRVQCLHMLKRLGVSPLPEIDPLTFDGGDPTPA